MKRSRAWGVVLAVACAVAGACGGKTNGSGDLQGGETNWLGRCVTSADCGVGECICGICTEHCSVADPCKGGGAVTCVSLGGVEFEALCGVGSDVDTAVCAAGCGGDADCGENLQCNAGVCVPRPGVLGLPLPDGTGTVVTEFADALAGGFESTSGFDSTSPKGRCLEHLPLPADGATPCTVLSETFDACDCGAPGREAASADERDYAAARAQERGQCGGDGQITCDDVCVCRLVEETGDALDRCRRDPTFEPSGWCYVDPSADLGEPALVEGCPPSQKSVIRFGSFQTPTFIDIVCTRTLTAPLVPGTGTAAIGDVCVPALENATNFPGFVLEGVSVSDSGTCASGLCLVANFQGRVSCPYGTLNGGTCLTPEGNDVNASLTVNPQLEARRPADAVTCSCRCAGPDPSAEYCTCPEGFSCKEMIPSIGPETGVQGSYCVPNGTYFALDPHQVPPGDCNAELANCEP